MAQILLHGTLHATIFEVDKLKSNFVHKILDRLECVAGLNAPSLYATIDLEKVRAGRTRMLEHDSNPQWNESFHIYCAHT
ncbi:putative phospholipase D [Helianthus debilis subsp. tardiflorus]